LKIDTLVSLASKTFQPILFFYAFAFSIQEPYGANEQTRMYALCDLLRRPRNDRHQCCAYTEMRI